jgi:aconitase A
MRDAMAAFGGDPRKINPLIPAELVIDHSVIADVFARPDAFRVNAELEFERNRERYQLLRWAQQAFDDFLASPPLVIAYALTGTMHADLTNDPLGLDADGRPVYLRDIWPTTQEIKEVMDECLKAEMFTAGYAKVFDGDEDWRGLDVPSANMFAWDQTSTYLRQPPYFEAMPREPEPLHDIIGARVLALLGDSVTTDHISPAGAIQADSQASRAASPATSTQW